MVGLLYKDYVAINNIGKIKLTWLLTLYMMVFVILRIAFPGTAEAQEFLVTNEQGETIHILDAFFLLFYITLVISSVSFLSVNKIMGHDEKYKIKEYLNTMPVGKNDYIASKYIFIGISTYVLLSVSYVLGIICLAFCREGRIQDVTAMVNSLVTPFVFFILFLAAVEFPLYFRLGKEKAMRVMVVFWTCIALVVIGYLMFGDLSLIAEFDLMDLMDFMEIHKTGVLIFQGLEPVIVLLLYYLSYRLSCSLYGRKKEEM